MLGGDAGNSFGVQAEVGEWRGFELVDLHEHRVSVLRGGVKSEMLRANVVIKEPWLAAVFSSARVQIHHGGLPGAGCDRASFFRFVFRFRALECPLFVPLNAKRREPAATLRRLLRPSLLRMPRLVLHAFVTHSNGLVNGDEIRKDCLHIVFMERFERR